METRIHTDGRLWLVRRRLTGIFASSRGRSGFGWFLLGIPLGIFALILVALLPSLKAPPRASSPIYVGREIATPETHVRCPDCKGFVHREARKCPHCGSTLVPATEQAARASSAFVARGATAPGVFDSELPADTLAERMADRIDRITGGRG